MKHVAIIGGGFAGLSAAVRLAEKGVRVTLLEGRKHLGGRAYSFTDRTTGDTVDNGQHLFMGCYHSTIDFLQRIGTADRLHFQDRFQIDFSHPQDGLSRLAFPSLPSPFHLLLGFLRFQAITTADLLRLRHIKPHLKTPPAQPLTVETWLNQCYQSPQIRQAFWDPLCIAVLNEYPQNAPAHHLIAVLREAFFGPPNGARMGYAQVGLSTLYTHHAQRFIEKHSGSVRTGATVNGLVFSPDNTLRLHIKPDESVQANACICTIPPPALARLLANHPFPDLLTTLSHYTPSPILSINLWLNSSILDLPFLGLLGTDMEWIFNKPRLSRDQNQACHLVLVASAARHLMHFSDTELIDLALKDLRATLPKAQNVELLHARVIREKRATFSLPVGTPAPDVQTDHPNLFLAGDWTNTGLPSTIEGAVRSGYSAADHAMRLFQT
ncbi:MAG: hydroxysqualene dehydroxylase HpnE [bacterium]|nr:hydroxysqualene dehydroxylase HpnE [bacterium]